MSTMLVKTEHGLFQNGLQPYIQAPQQQSEKNMGAWSSGQQQKYIIFLEFNKKIFHSPHKRKQLKVFKMMSEFIGTRNGIQCRSHHMKQMKVHKNKVRNIIACHKKRNDLEAYAYRYQELIQHFYLVPERVQSGEREQNEEGEVEQAREIQEKVEERVEIQDQREKYLVLWYYQSKIMLPWFEEWCRLMPALFFYRE